MITSIYLLSPYIRLLTNVQNINSNTKDKYLNLFTEKPRGLPASRFGLDSVLFVSIWLAWMAGCNFLFLFVVKVLDRSCFFELCYFDT
ncbi:hypothetical protein ACJX0J_030084, partial [Zea mays]